MFTFLYKKNSLLHITRYCPIPSIADRAIELYVFHPEVLVKQYRD